MLAYGFSAFYAGVIGLIATFSIPGDQVILAGASGILMGHGFVTVVFGRFYR